MTTVRDFIMGTGMFSENELVKMNNRVAGKIAEKASKALMERFAEEFNTSSEQVVVELDLPSPSKKTPMPHAWSSDPARDEKVRMEEDGRTNPHPTLAERLRGEGAASPVSASEHLEIVRKVQLAAWDERDRADEARARYRKRWRERGKTIAKLQARLNERKQSVPNIALRKWSEALENRLASLTVEFREAVVDGKYLRSVVNDYEDRVGELNMKVCRLEGDLDFALQSHTNATERRLAAEESVKDLAYEVDVLRKNEGFALGSWQTALDQRDAAVRELDDAARNRDRLHGELGEVRQQLATAIREREELREQLESVCVVEDEERDATVGENEPWQKAILNDAVSIIVDGGDWGRGNDMNHGKLGAAVIWAEKEIGRLRAGVAVMEEARKRFDTALEEARDASGINDLIVQRDEAFAECDAAIRDLSKSKLWKDNLAMQRNEIRDERDTLKARVAVLEAQLESVADRAAAAETALESAPAASEWRDLKVGEVVQAGDEMRGDVSTPWCDVTEEYIGQEHIHFLYYSFRRRVQAPAASGRGQQLREQVAAIVHEAMGFYRVAETWTWQGENSFAEDRARQSATEIVARKAAAEIVARQAAAEIVELMQAASGGGEGEPVAWRCEWTDHTSLYLSKTQAEIDSGGDIVPQPLYLAPPQPRGWLSEREVWALRVAADNLPGMEDADGEPLDPLEGVFRNLLARSSPPEVVLPRAFDVVMSAKAVRSALDTAGVPWKEVGGE